MKNILHIYGGDPSQGKLRRIIGLFADDGYFHEMYFFNFSNFSSPSKNLSPASNIIIRTFTVKWSDHVKLPFIYYLLRLWGYARIAQNIIPKDCIADLVLVHEMSWSLYLGNRLSKQLDIPLGLELHDLQESRKEATILYLFYQKYHKPFTRAVARPYLKKVDFHLAQTALILNYLKRTMNFNPRFNAVAPNGVDLVKFNREKWQQQTATMRKKYGWGNSVVILYSGYLDEINGINFLIKTVLSYPVKSARLVIAGTGTLKYKVESMSRQNLRQYLGEIPWEDMPALLATCDIFIIPRIRTSSGEIFIPIKLIEAMASGCAVLASELSAIRECIDNDKNGWLFEPENEYDFNNKLKSLIKDCSLRTRLGNAAKDTAAKNFDWSKSRVRFKEVMGKITES